MVPMAGSHIVATPVGDPLLAPHRPWNLMLHINCAVNFTQFG